MATKKEILEPVLGQQQLKMQAADLIKLARTQVVTQTNSLMVFTYFQVGRLIVEHEQQGKQKAEYGKATISAVSKKLSQ